MNDSLFLIKFISPYLGFAWRLNSAVSTKHVDLNMTKHITDSDCFPSASAFNFLITSSNWKKSKIKDTSYSPFKQEKSTSSCIFAWLLYLQPNALLAWVLWWETLETEIVFSQYAAFTKWFKCQIFPKVICSISSRYF